MLSPLKNNLESKVDGKWSMRLTDAVEDVELMLSILYGSRVSLDTVSVDQLDRSSCLHLLRLAPPPPPPGHSKEIGPESSQLYFGNPTTLLIALC